MIVAIDPGHTRTGVVLMENSGEPIAAATFAADTTMYPDQQRATDLARRVRRWVTPYSNAREDMCGEAIILSIERPIMGKNVLNFEKQMRLFTLFIQMFGPMVSHVCEVTPTGMKKAVTGNGAAKKIDIIGASPFDGPGDWGHGQGESDANQEAVADAWGIGVTTVKGLWDVRYPAQPLNDASRGPIWEWNA